MEESPRASKRRKLDTPSPAPPTSSAKPSTARKSSRLANKPTVRHTFTNDDDDGSEDEVVPAVAAPTRKRVTRKPSRPAIPQKETENPDIWDDIEAASGERSVAPTLLRSIPAAKKTPARRSAQSRGKASKGQESDELHVTAPTPRSTKKSNATKERRLNKRTTKLVTNGSTEDFEVEADTSDELGQVTTAGKRPPTSIRKTASTRQSKNTDQSQPFTTTGKAASSKKPPKKPAASSGTNGASRVTPARSSRRQQPRPQENGAMSYDEDELEVAPQESPSAVKNSTRRKLHRANHTSNEDDEIIVDAEENLESDIQEDGGDNMSVDGNSIAGSTLDPTEPSPFNKPSPAQKSDLVTPKLSIHLEAGQGLDLLKSILLERIAGKRPAPLINLDEEYSSVYQIIHQTITAGEGNSMLVIGARGSGKTALVNNALAEVHKENREDYHVVRLNGFIHTDDKIALREIWRQLGKEMELDEEGGGVGKSYADALTTLLALLSHPSEQTGEETDYTARAVIFIMDEFDLFAQHARQTLLYNLFDIAQSRKAPIAVLGLTTRIDVANSLEKRVKSRFSHRYVHLSLAKTFSAFQDMCKANLLVHTDQLSIAERAILEPSISSPATKQKKGEKSNLLADWNKNINTLFTNKSFLTTHLAPIYHLTKSIPELLTTFLDPIAALSPSTSTLDPPSTTSLPPTSKLSLIPHLSTLALSLLIAAARLDIIHDSDTCNFNMAYDEYVSLASKARIQNGVGGVSVGGSMSKVWGKEVARREWEGLVELGFVMPVLLGAVGGFGMVRVDVALEEIGAVLRGGAAKGVEKGLERWCRQI